MQRLKANHCDECLHRVVGEHPATAAVTGTCSARDTLFHFFVVASCDLEAGNDIDAFLGYLIKTRADGTVRHYDGRPVIAQEWQRVCRQVVYRRRQLQWCLQDHSRLSAHKPCHA